MVLPDRSLAELHLKLFEAELSSFSVLHAYLNQLEELTGGLNL